MTDLETLIRDGDESEGAGFTWPGLGAGILVFILILVVLHIFRCSRRRARTEIRTSVLPAQNPHPHLNTHGPFRPPDPNRPLLSVPHQPPPVYMSRHVGGQYILFPAESQGPPWAQSPYPGQVVGVHPHSLRDPDAVPRFNPDDLISFDVTGDDKQNPCPICLGLLEEEPVSTGQCLHLMHTSCLKSWLAKDVKSACPVCRVSFADNAGNDVDNAISVANGETRDANRPNNTTAAQTAARHTISLR